MIGCTVCDNRIPEEVVIMDGGDTICLLCYSWYAARIYDKRKEKEK